MEIDQIWKIDGKPAKKATLQPANTMIFLGDEQLDEIVERLNQSLPNDIYLSQEVLAGLIGVSVKTLANRRTMNPEKYPTPIYFAGSKRPRFSRADVFKWFALEEYSAKKIFRHKCI